MTGTTIARPLALAVLLIVALAAPALAATRAERYVDRLAANAVQAKTEDGCVVLHRVDLCGWRVRLVTQTEMLGVDVADCNGWGRTCSYELTGMARGEQFFCNGTVGYYPRRNRWLADQQLNCYGDRDPSWGVTEDGVLFREP